MLQRKLLRLSLPGAVREWHRCALQALKLLLDLLLLCLAQPDDGPDGEHPAALMPRTAQVAHSSAAGTAWQLQPSSVPPANTTDDHSHAAFQGSSRRGCPQQRHLLATCPHHRTAREPAEHISSGWSLAKRCVLNPAGRVALAGQLEGVVTARLLPAAERLLGDEAPLPLFTLKLLVALLEARPAWALQLAQYAFSARPRFRFGVSWREDRSTNRVE